MTGSEKWGQKPRWELRENLQMWRRTKTMKVGIEEMNFFWTVINGKQWNVDNVVWGLSKKKLLSSMIGDVHRPSATMSMILFVSFWPFLDENIDGKKKIQQELSSWAKLGSVCNPNISEDSECIRGSVTHGKEISALTLTQGRRIKISGRPNAMSHDRGWLMYQPYFSMFSDHLAGDLAGVVDVLILGWPSPSVRMCQSDRPAQQRLMAPKKMWVRRKKITEEIQEVGVWGRNGVTGGFSPLKKPLSSKKLGSHGSIRKFPVEPLKNEKPPTRWGTNSMAVPQWQIWLMNLDHGNAPWPIDGLPSEMPKTMSPKGQLFLRIPHCHIWSISPNPTKHFMRPQNQPPSTTTNLYQPLFSSLWTIINKLVGGWATPLKNMKVNWDD